MGNTTAVVVQFGLVMILPMLLLLTLDPDGVAARKRAEEEALAGVSTAT